MGKTNQSKEKVAFLVSYFGKWPNFLPLFLESCKRNLQCHFFLFSDHDVKCELPQNVTITKMSINEFCKKASEALGTDVVIFDAHKICDLKPFYGMIFEEYIRGYEFWGYCDIDVVFGDLSKVINPRRLMNFDVYSPCDTQIVGHFVIFRNSETLNTSCLQIENWKNRLSVPISTFMSEGGISEVFWRNPNIKYERPLEWNKEFQKSFAEIGITILYDGRIWRSPSPRAFAFWKDGRAYAQLDNNRAVEVLYIHFMGIKRWIHWLRYHPEKSYRAFKFSAAGFVPWLDPPSFLCTMSEGALKILSNALVRSRQAVGKVLPRGRRIKVVQFLTPHKS